VRTDEAVKYLLIDLAGAGRREVWLPLPTDAETEARVSGTAFFKLIGERYYYLRQDARTNRWEVHVTSEPIQSAHLVARARLTMP